MAATTQIKPNIAPSAPTLIGWQGITFQLPPEWNVTGFSVDRADGYLKVDSPGTMFAQVRWIDPRFKRARTLGDVAFQLWKRRRPQPSSPEAPDLRATLDHFLAQTRKQLKKTRAQFDCKVKPETKQAGGERTVLHFSWTGPGQGQGKIWHCAGCGRTVIAQIVGQGRDNVADVAAQMFSGFRDHSEDGWDTWALYDLQACVPDSFRLRSQKLMSGYLKLEFDRRGGERLTIERWGLANVTRKKFTLAEWFAHSCEIRRFRASTVEAQIREHGAVRAQGRVRNPIELIRAFRDAFNTFRLASRYEACCWECPESNKIYAVQLWHNSRTVGLLEEVAERCACH